MLSGNTRCVRTGGAWAIVPSVMPDRSVEGVREEVRQRIVGPGVSFRLSARTVCNSSLIVVRICIISLETRYSVL